MHRYLQKYFLLNKTYSSNYSPLNHLVTKLIYGVLQKRCWLWKLHQNFYRAVKHSRYLDSRCCLLSSVFGNFAILATRCKHIGKNSFKLKCGLLDNSNLLVNLLFSNIWPKNHSCLEVKIYSTWGPERQSNLKDIIRIYDIMTIT